MTILNNREILDNFISVQALEETKLNQVRIMSELEKEKKKMQEDVLKLKEAKVHTTIKRISSYYYFKIINNQ